MSLLASWRTALRIARREAARAKGRSAMVVAMIAVPVACLAFAASSYDMFTLTAKETADRTMGTADARISWNATGPVQQTVMGESWQMEPSNRDTPSPDGAKAPTEADLLAKLPAGTTVLPLRSGIAEVATVDGIAQPNAIAVDAGNPMTNGYVKVLQGRPPRTTDEVALTKEAVDRFHQDLGGSISNGDGSRKYTVVGVVEFPSRLEQTLLFAPTLADDTKGLSFYANSWLAQVPAPITWAEVQHLNTFGITVISRQVLLDPPPDSQVPNPYTGGIQPRDLAVGVIVAGLALLEIVLLAGPAFAVSARRRQRQLALVAANGGTPAHVRRIVLADGVVLGLVGAIAGIVLGIPAAFLARPYIEEFLAHSRAGGYRVLPLALVAIAVLAIITGVLAALVPAFITARQNVISSLAGRRGATRSKKRWIAVGLALVVAGTPIVIYGAVTISAYTMLGGLVLAELGLVFCTPALVGLIARIGRILPLAPRIALRDAARNRAAAAPAISAVMAAVAGSVAIGLYFETNIVQQQRNYHASTPLGYVTVYAYDSIKEPGVSQASIEAALRNTLPVTDIRELRSFDCPGSDEQRFCSLKLLVPEANACPYTQQYDQGITLSAADQRAASHDPRCADLSRFHQYGYIVDDGTALPVMTGANAPDLSAASEVLRAGGVVVSDPVFIKDGKASFKVIDAGPTDPDPERNARTISVPAIAMASGIRLDYPILSPGSVRQAGFEVGTERRSVIAATTRMPTVVEEERFVKQFSLLKLSGAIEHGPRIDIPVELWIIMAAAALITLGAAGIGTGLAAADGRADLSTLASVGASPRLRRGLSLSQSAVIAGLGSILGAAAGLGAAVAILFALNQSWDGIWPAPEPRPIVMPWLSLGVALVVVPLIAILGAGLLTRSRLPIERRL